MSENPMCYCGHPLSDHNNADSCGVCGCRCYDEDAEAEERARANNAPKNNKSPRFQDWTNEKLKRKARALKAAVRACVYTVEELKMLHGLWDELELRGFHVRRERDEIIKITGGPQ